MSELFKNLQNDRILFFGFFTALAFLIAIFICILISYPNLPPLIPLFNQLPWGVNRLSEKQQIFIPLVIAILIFILNWFLSLRFYDKIPLISRFFSVTSVFVSFLTFLFIIRTVQLIS